MQKARQEILELIIVTLVLGFCFSFRDWGFEQFDFAIGLTNFFTVMLLTAFSVAIHELAHAFIGQHYGVRIITKTWKPMLLLALLFTFLTNGWLVFAAIWSIIIISPVYRIGRKFPHTGPYERAKMAVVGPLVNIILLIVGGVLYSISPIFIFEKLMFINGTLAVFNLFPFFRFAPMIFAGIMGKRSGLENELLRGLHRSLMSLQKHDPELREVPFMEGELVFFGSRPIWVFVFTFSFFLFFVIMTSKEWLSSVLSSLAFAAILYFLWMFFFEPWSYEYTGPSQRDKSPRPW